MTDRELLQRLKTAVDHTAPDDVQDVLSRCGTGKGTVIHMNEAKKSRKSKSWTQALIAACLALVLLAGGGGIFYQRAYAVASVVSLDVNPSIQLEVNRSEKVLSCSGLNDEGRTVLADMDGGRDLKGAKLDVAVNAIVGALVRNGYLDHLDSAILISVEDSDADRGARLQQELVASVDGVLQTAANNASVLSQNVAASADLDARARENSISTGKASLIDQVLALNGELSFEELAGLSVEELRDLIKIGAPDMPIGRDAALQAALDFAGLTRESVPYVDVDPELDERVPYYEVELVVDGKEQDYGVQAFTGEVIQGVAIPDMLTPGPALPQDTAAVTEAEAEAIAWSDAGVAENASTVVKQDWDDGRLHWDVWFTDGGYEYEYEIDAATGAILSSEREPVSRTVTSVTAPVSPGPAADSGAASGDVGEAAAKAAALAHAGLSESQVTRLTCQRDYDDGRLEYEIEFRAGGYEYEYTVDGATGSILDHERDWDDDVRTSASSAQPGGTVSSGASQDSRYDDDWDWDDDDDDDDDWDDDHDRDDDWDDDDWDDD